MVVVVVVVVVVVLAVVVEDVVVVSPKTLPTTRKIIVKVKYESMLCLKVRYQRQENATAAAACAQDDAARNQDPSPHSDRR